MVSRWIWFFISLTLFSKLAFAAEEVHFRTIEISVGRTRLKVEVAENEQQYQRGLMYRNRLDQNRGMLFIFKNEEPRSFWMKNTFIPLDIGYFSKSKKLLEIIAMDAVPSEMSIPKSYPSTYPSMYALEVNRGWFAKNQVVVGDSLKILK